MNRIKQTFTGGGKLITYIVAGDPDFEKSIEIADSLIQSEIDLLELGLPFSDPIADGPTIQKAAKRALDAGMNTDKYFELIGKIREKHDIPIVCMTYYNLILQYGLEKFAKTCKETGVDGLIIPNLPIEEATPLHKECEKYDVDLIYLVAQTTTDERLEKIAEQAKGFTYVVSLLGTTGARKDVSPDVKPLLKRVKGKIDTPLAVGFGISNPQHVKKVIDYGADAAIIGSAIVKLVEEKRYDEIAKFTKTLKKAITGD